MGEGCDGHCERYDLLTRSLRGGGKGVECSTAMDDVEEVGGDWLPGLMVRRRTCFNVADSSSFLLIL